MTTTDPTTKLADQIRYAWRDAADPTVIGLVQALSAHAIEMLAVTAAEATTEHLDPQPPAPLAVGDRVRVVVPEWADGLGTGVFASGDVGTVKDTADKDGDIRFQRDGTSLPYGVAAANVERIKDTPRVGDLVRIDKAERADGETSWLPEVGKEYRVLSAADSDGDLVTEQDDDGLHRIVDARHVTVIRRAER